MTQHIRGIVEAVKNTDVITKKKDGSDCKPWHSSFLKVGGVVYKLGYVSQQWGPHVKVGDDVEFDFIEKSTTDDMGEQKIVREIKNDFDEKDETKKFRNHTNPSKPAGSGFKGGGYKKDPEESLRIAAMNAMGVAQAYLAHNNPETKYGIEELFKTQEQIENHILMVSMRRKVSNFQNNVPNVNEGVTNKFVDDDIPF